MKENIFTSPIVNTFRDRIKGLELRHIGMLNFTYHAKLRRPSGSSTAAPQQTSRSRQGIKKSLVYCGSCTAAAIYVTYLGHFKTHKERI